jgi:hypothetical protein
MLNSKTDYFFVIIFFIVVAAFLGISIVNIIDKKLSNISINIPKIKLPPSEVTVNFEKSGSNYKVKCSKKEIKKNTSESNKIDEDYLELPLNNNIDTSTKEKDLNNQEPNLNQEVKLESEPKVSYTDYESEVEDNLDENDILEVRENMTGLTAEQFFNKHYINPYKPLKRKNNENKEFEAFNNIEYQ